jgi:4-hydroxyacetophenone monooxygenase
VDPDYLESLNRSNVNITWDAIESIEANGIRLKAGEFIELDIIIFATGYSLVRYGRSIQSAYF